MGNREMIFFALGVIILVAIVLFGSRIRAHYGRLDPSDCVSEAFARHQRNPDFSYYLAGSAAHPVAVIGISPAFTLKTDLWSPFRGDDDAFAALLDAMEQQARITRLRFHGFEIRDQKGRYVGDGYTFLGVHMVIKGINETDIDISAPTGDDCDRYEETKG